MAMQLRPLPTKKLIVSCYLESMKGAERYFIDAVANIENVGALRIEGLFNIAYARGKYPDLFIIGLVKECINGKTVITPTEGLGAEIISAGADMVATECYTKFFDFDTGACFKSRMMFDLGKTTDGSDLFANKDRSGYSIFLDYLDNGHIILATTYQNLGYKLLNNLREAYPIAKLNFEGGITCKEHIDNASYIGADYITIGKAINDPVFIIKQLLGE